MLKQAHSPDGYKHLLVYTKAEELLAFTLDFTATFPHEKTLNDLEDQMCRSARSVKANIVEGWKRNATHEYYTFLGYAVASNEELLEDCRDICHGVYEQRGLKGEKGERRGSEEKGIGEKGKGRTKEETRTDRTSLSPVCPISPFSPKPISTFSSGKEWIEKLRFYPPDLTLPPVVKLFLQAKEIRFLIDKLQTSLVELMQEKKTLSQGDMIRRQNEQRQKSDKWLRDDIKSRGFVMTTQGLKTKEEAETLGLEILKI